MTLVLRAVTSQHRFTINRQDRFLSANTISARAPVTQPEKERLIAELAGVANADITKRLAKRDVPNPSQNNNLQVSRRMRRFVPTDLRSRMITLFVSSVI